MDLYLTDEFSPDNLLTPYVVSNARFRTVSFDEIPIANVFTLIRHVAISNALSKLLGYEVAYIPRDGSPKPLYGQGVIVYLVQYHGPCYNPNSKELPEGAFLDYVEISFQGCCTGCPYIGKSKFCKDCIPETYDTLG
jgi:hypothetical protein